MHTQSFTYSWSITTFIVSVCFFFWLTTPLYTHAQISEQGNQSAITLVPPFPEPGSLVEASIEAYTVDTTGASIIWSLDGIEIPGSKNNRRVKISVGELGQNQVLTATVQPLSGASFVLRKDIVPTALDIVVEASTYVPSFYRGRALPSAESEARIIAIPHVGNTDPKALTYQWEQNGNMLFGGPVKGMQSITISTPRYSGGYLTVSVYGTDGGIVARESISITAAEPELHFYEENPLRGLSELAIRNNLSLIGDEAIVHGEGYYLRMEGGETYEWEINGGKATPNLDPHTITLRKTGAGGIANLGLEIVSDYGVPEFLQGGFSINF